MNYASTISYLLLIIRWHTISRAISH